MGAEPPDQLQAELAELRSSRRRLVAANDRERSALEHALHDGLQQSIVAMAANLQVASRLVEEDPPAAGRLLDEVASVARLALEQTVQLAQAIYPPMLEVRGLASALRSAAAIAGVRTHVEVVAAAQMPGDVVSSVYWCCLEALSLAPVDTPASIRVREVGSALVFEVDIAGHFSDEALERMRDRAEALDGRIEVREATNGGQRVSGRLPFAG